MKTNTIKQEDKIPSALNSTSTDIAITPQPNRRAPAPPNTLRGKPGILGRTPTRAGDIALNLLVWFLAVFFCFPLVFAFFSSLKSKDEVGQIPPTLIGKALHWHNYLEVFEYAPFGKYILNSLFISIAGTLLVLFVSCTAGYAFARLRWRARNIIFAFFLATMMIPGEIMLIPLFQLIQTFKWMNTYQALIIPGAFGAFGTFLMCQFMRGIPIEIEESARVDGAGPIRTFFQIVLPQVIPPLAVLAVFSFIGYWSTYVWPLVVTVDYEQLGTLQIGLASFKGQAGSRDDLQMAAAMLAMIPTTVLVILLQKHLVKGISLSGFGGR